MWSPLNAPYPYYADATQSGAAPLHVYQGSDNRPALLWALMKAATDPNHEPFVVPPGFAMTGPLFATDETGAIIRNPQLNIVSDKGGVLIPNDSCAGQPVFDLTGLAGSNIDGLSIGRAAFNPNAKPSSIMALGIGPASGNEVHIDGMSLFGMTTHATLFNQGSVSSSIRRSQVHSYGGGYAMWHQNATGWKMDVLELHESSVKWRQDMRISPGPYYDGYGDKSASRFDNCGDFKFDTGNIGGNSPSAVEFYGHNQKFTLDAVQMYAQDPAPKLANGQPGPGKPFNIVIKNYGVVETLRVLGCRTDGAAAMYGAVSGAIYRDLRHEGYVGPFVPANMVACDAAATFEDVVMDCSGLPFNANAHLGGVLRRATLRNVSSIDAIKQGVVWSTPDGRWHTDQPWLVG